MGPVCPAVFDKKQSATKQSAFSENQRRKAEKKELRLSCDCLIEWRLGFCFQQKFVPPGWVQLQVATLCLTL
jgi:hypothetical protein